MAFPVGDTNKREKITDYYAIGQYTHYKDEETVQTPFGICKRKKNT